MNVCTACLETLGFSVMTLLMDQLYVFVKASRKTMFCNPISISETRQYKEV